MWRRWIGVITMACGAGLLALVLVNAGPEPVVAYSDREEIVLALGALLLVIGLWCVIRGSRPKSS